MPNLKIVAIIFMATIGCNTQSEQQTDHHNNIPETEESISSYLKDSITINDGGNNSVARVNIIDPPSCTKFDASIYIAHESKLILYQTSNKSVVQTINLSNQLKKEKADIFVDTGYNIFAIKWMQNEVLMLDTNGLLQDRFNYPTIDNKRNFSVYLHPIFSCFYYNKNKDFIFYTIPAISISDAKSMQSFLNNKPIKVFSLNRGKVTIKNEGGSYPAQYKHDNYYDFDIKYTLIDDSTIAYIFKMFPQIIFENVYTGRVEKKDIAGLDSNVSEKYINQENDFTYIKEYGVKNDTYNGLTFDKTKKRYYLFRNKGIPTMQSDGGLALYEDKPVYLYVIDGLTFKVIKKIYCGLEGKYWYSKPFIRNSQLFLTRRVEDKKGAPIKIDIYDIP
jgi:hypothetical protein